jgi:hypothetical protein
MKADLMAWENEGRAPISSPGLEHMNRSLLGTTNQIEWAESIRARVNTEFDRVAASFRSIADRQGDKKRADTEAVILILEDKRAQVMSRERAGYFIRHWQEISDQVRQMIGQDPRYQAIKAKREARQCSAILIPSDSAS